MLAVSTNCLCRAIVHGLLMRSKNNKILEDQLAKYKEKRRDYESFGRLVAGFLEAEVQDSHRARTALPLLHGVDSRAKTVASVRGKVERNGRNSAANRKKTSVIDIFQFNDLAGARVIFYFEDDMEWFLCWDFEKLFGKETKDSVDEKRHELDSFGYASTHFTVRCAASSHFTNSLRADDRERFAGMVCEVQVRTILQHVWAETAHDIIYKRATEEPITTDEQKAERLFYAMAATLELLDDQLVVLKRQYKNTLSEPSTTTPNQPLIPDWAIDHPKIFAHRGVKYPYLLVHTGDLSKITFSEDVRMYDSGRTFGIPEYKDIVWAHLLKQHKAFVASLNSYDSTTVRVKSWTESSMNLELQPALYSDQATTNHRNAHRCRLPNEREVKDYAFDDGRLLDFAESPLANSLGVACAILTSDSYWVIGKRRAGLSVFANRWSCPVSGAVEWRERGKWNPATFEDWVVESILLECDQEIGLRIDKKHVKYLGFAREIDRLGKPQIFFLLDLRTLPEPAHDVPTMKARYNIYRIDDEFSGLDFLKASVVRDALGKGWDEFVKLTNGEEPSMELLTCLALAERHLNP